MQHVGHRASNRTNEEVARIKARIAELTQAIEKSPGWGAAVGAMHEERRGLEAALNILEDDARVRRFFPERTS